MNHLMLDLETLGKKPGCRVLTVGAVVFNVEQGILQRHYMRLDWVAQEHLHIDASTLKWWLDQAEDVRKEAFGGCMQLPAANGQLNELYTHWNCSRVWAHGAPFDPPIWQEAVGSLFIPWDFRAIRDTRTIFDLLDIKLQHAPGTSKHNALDDAVTQAEAVIGGLRRLAVPPTRYICSEPGCALEAVQGLAYCAIHKELHHA